MKKIKYSLILIFVLGLFVYLPSVNASTKCSSRGKDTCTTENGGKDDDGNTCGFAGQSSSCTITSYACQDGKKHCKCYKAATCPAKDDYGNKCHELTASDECETQSEYEARVKPKNITPCAERLVNTCVTENGGKDKDGNTCYYTGGSCQVKKYACEEGIMHCKCYDSNTCPSYDDYGNKCHAYPTAGCVTETEYQADQTRYDDGTYDNYEENSDVTCGNGLTFNKSIANITHYMVLLFQIIAPSLLIVLGMIDLFKGFASGKDDVIKKSQGTFIKRLIVAVTMFLVITIVRFVIGFFDDQTIMDCFNCFVNGAKSC